ncbi:MAG: hypothetical protein I4N51_23350, partial [Acinetobacter sp.]|nr:hypothetical protein [Acinetobacter sp.]
MPQRKLFLLCFIPNQFVNVRLNTQTIQNAISIPSDAVQHGAKGSYVYIINP